MVYSEEHAKDRAMIVEKYGFTDIQYAMFQRTRIFSAREYSTLLGTYSDHIAIDETIRIEFSQSSKKQFTRMAAQFPFTIQ